MSQSVKERFWKYVPKNINNNECWNWKGYIGTWGYGRIADGKGGAFKAHRVSYIIHNGEIPQNKIVRHTCDNPACVNPMHLIIGTHADNANDKRIRKRGIKIPDEIVRKIIRETGTYRVVGEKYSVSPAFVCMVKNGKRRQQQKGELNWLDQ